MPTRAPATPTVTVPSKRVLMSASRGGAGLGPENMLSTFRIGLGYHADFVDMNVHLTKDGIPVTIHDATLERTSDSFGPVSNRTFAELLHINGAAIANKSYGEAIPKLADVLDLARYSSSGLEIEIRLDADGKPYPGIEQKVIAEADARNMLDRVRIMASEFDTLKRVRAINPNIKTIALLTGDYFRNKDINQPAAIIDDVSSFADGIGVDKNFLTPELTNAAHNRKLVVGVWTMDTAEEMRKFFAMGVDSITTNRPDVYRSVIGW